MSAESAADLAGMVSTDDFAVAGTYTPAATGTPATVNGVLARPSLPLLPGEVGGLSGRDSQFVCAEADLPAAAAEGDGLVAGGTSWTVKLIEPDGTGLARLQLWRA